MKFLLKGNKELSFSELIELNGGYGGSSGGSSKSSRSSSKSGGYSGSSGGSKNYSKPGKSSKKSGSSKAYSATSGGRYHLNDERVTIFSDGSSYSSLTGFHSASDSSSSSSSTSNGQSTNTKSGGKTTKINTADTTNGGDISVANGGIEQICTDKNNDITSKIISKINSDLESGSIKYNENDNGFMCDNYVQSVLKDCGVDYSGYFAGEADKKTCAEHIANLDSNGKYDASIVKAGNSYVCFMGESLKNYQEHCAILVATKNGGYYMVDNSSGNNDGKGGLEITYAKSMSELQSKFGYNKFYYQKVK